MNLTDLLNHRDQISAEIFRQTGDATVVPVVASAKLTKNGKVRKVSANKGKPTARGDFTKMITTERADDFAAYKEANPDLKGPHLSWYKHYIDQHNDEYEAFKTTWALEHPKETASDTESAANPEGAEAAEAAEAKPKKVLSPEHLAKMKAGREAKLAEKKAAKDQLEADAKANVSISLAPVLAAEPVASLMPVAAKLKQPKKVTKKAAAVVPVAPLVPLAVPVPEEASAEELPFKHNGVTYIRIGVAKSNGNHEWSSTDLWHSKKGARASYAGELMENGEINEDAEEPNLV